MTNRTYRALLVANSTFPADAHNLQELEGPRNDPALLRDALCDRDAGLVPSDNVRLVTERTMTEVLREVEDFVCSASRDDTLLLYYSGHGVLDQTNELFLCTRDSRIDRLRSTAVKASDVRQMIDNSMAGTTVILLDCCHSGRWKGGEIPAALSGRGSFVVTSSRSGELANDTDVRNHASLFTHHLVEGLLHGAKDRDGDGIVNLSELYEYVHGVLSETGRPVPQKRFAGDGEVPIALRGSASNAHPRPGLLDPTLVAPLLDVPVTDIDLGEIDADVVLPPERLAIVNRGGGTLDWSAESSVDWARVERSGNDLVVHLRPHTGPNRANIYVRDALTGAITTVRMSVRVRPGAHAKVNVDPGADRLVSTAGAVAPPVVEADDSSGVLIAEPAAVLETPSNDPVAVDERTIGPVSTGVPLDVALTSTSVPEHPDPEQTAPERTTVGRRPAVERRLSIVAAASAVIAGVSIVFSALDASDTIMDNFGYRLIVREFGIVGLLWEILAGVFLALAGLLAFRRRSVDIALGAVVGVAVPLGIDRWGAHTQAMDDCGCLGGSNVFAFGGAAGWCLWAAAVSATAILVNRGWATTRWMSTKSVGVTALLALGWGAASAIDFYGLYGDRFGSYNAGTATPWHVALTMTIVGVIVLASRLEPDVGAGMLVGAVAMPVTALLAEGVYIAGVIGEGTYSWFRIWPLVVVTVALVLAVALPRRSDRQESVPPLE